MNTKRIFYFFIFSFFVAPLIVYTFNITISGKPVKAERDLSEIIFDNVLNVVTEYSSIDFQLTDGDLTEFQYELSQFISERSGLTVKYHFENDLDNNVRRLQNNTYDVIARNIPINSDNRQYLAFTVPTGQSKQVLVQRKKNNDDSARFISNQLDFANQTIYVAKNSPAIMRLKNLSEEIAEPIHIKQISDYTPEELMYMVSRKEIDYMATDMETILRNSKLFTDLDFNTDIGFTQLQAWAVRKSSPVLLDSMNVWMTAFADLKQQKGKR